MSCTTVFLLQCLDQLQFVDIHMKPFGIQRKVVVAMSSSCETLRNDFRGL